MFVFLNFFPEQHPSRAFFYFKVVNNATVDSPRDTTFITIIPNNRLKSKTYAGYI